MQRPIRTLAIVGAVVLLSLTFTSPTTADPGDWDLRGNAGTSPGFHFLGTTDDRALVVKVNDQRALLIDPSPVSPNLIGGASVNFALPGVRGATISGGGRLRAPNRVIARFGTVSGGWDNVAGHLATVGGGHRNLATDTWATVGGGFHNRATSRRATVSGGAFNVAEDPRATVGGGNGNTATARAATVGGGRSNIARGRLATVGGGSFNIAAGEWATVPGGVGNTARGDQSLAAGTQANADARGAFVWADSNAGDFDFAATSFPCGEPSCGANTFNVRSTGGARFVSAINPSTGEATAGVVLQPGAGSWSSLSDRHAKTDVRLVDPQAVLRTLAGVRISTFRYRAQDPGVHHMGPMAQDFHRVFGLGESPRYIATVDADGVALAGIKGLYAKVQTQGETIASLRADVSTLKSRLGDQGRQIAVLREELREVVAAAGG